MKQFVFALLVGATVLASAAPVLAESAAVLRPEGLEEAWVVVTDTPEIDISGDRK